MTAAFARVPVRQPDTFALIQMIAGPLVDGWRIPLEPGALLADLGLDDLDLATIAVELDEALGIEISDRAIEGWQTMADIVATVDLLVGAQSRQPEGQGA